MDHEELRREWSVKVSRSEPFEVGEFCPRKPYLELRVPYDAESVCRLTVTTVSHDQGFSNTEDVDRGTHNNSSSWLEVAVITPSYHERTPAKIFQHNLNAQWESQRYENTWDVGTDDDEALALLGPIQAGDLVQVIPRADFTLWVNYVLEVSIELEVTTVDCSAETSWAAQTANTAKFFSPLDASRQQTRVLSLNPGKMDDPISCDLRTVTLTDVLNEPYEALSYCWGSAGPSSQVVLRSESMRNGARHIFPISPNLHQALVHLRQEDGPPRKLWIDAICINQADAKERSQQVTQMSLVYSRAERVIIWLGLQDSPIRRHCISKLKSIQSRLQHEFDGSKKYTREEMDALEFRCVDPDIPLEQLIGFTNTWRGCDFDWFRRTWVLQEVSNARKAIVCCGPDTIEWTSFAATARRMLDAARGSPLIRYGLMPSLFFTVADRYLDDEKSSIESRVNEQEAVKHRDDILSVLIKAHSLKATDPRDKIFALLQFGQETHDIRALPVSIRPDYRKSVRRVFTDFVRWWIVEHKSVRILSAVHTLQWRSWHKMYQADPPSHDYPSWCLDLEHGGEANWAKATLGLHCSGETTSPSHTALTPDLDLISLSQDASASEHDTLRLRGRRICTIGEIIPFPYWVFHSFLEQSRQQQPPIEAGDEALDAISGLVEAFSHIFDPTALGRVWLLDRDNQVVQNASDQAGGARGPRFRDLHYTYHQWGFQSDSPDIPCMSPCMFRAVGAAGGAANVDADSADAAAPSSGRGFQLDKAGLCPHRAGPGDLVVLLNGGLVPYVLREVGEGDQASSALSGGIVSSGRRQYELVGECYLHGYMHGRASEESSAAGEQSEIFDLV